jgi:hypothetical protein
MALASLGDYATRYDLTGDTAARIEVALEDASSAIEASIGYTLLEDERTADIAFNGRRRLQLPAKPVTAVDSVTVDGIEWITPAYTWDVNGGLVRNDRYNWTIGGYATVVFTAGYATIPSDLVALTCRLANTRVTSGSSAGVKSESIGSYSITYMDGGTQFISTEDDAVLDRYRLPLAP